MIVHIDPRTNSVVWLNHGMLLLDKDTPRDNTYVDEFGCFNVKTNDSWIVHNPTKEWWEWFETIRNKAVDLNS